MTPGGDPPASEEEKTEDEIAALRRAFDKHALRSPGAYGTMDVPTFEKFYEEVRRLRVGVTSGTCLIVAGLIVVLV